MAPGDGSRKFAPGDGSREFASGDGARTCDGLAQGLQQGGGQGHVLPGGSTPSSTSPRRLRLCSSCITTRRAALAFCGMFTCGGACDACFGSDRNDVSIMILKTNSPEYPYILNQKP